MFCTRINGNVYDISTFVDRHPGGKELIELVRDQDATVLFYSYHRNVKPCELVLQQMPVVSTSLAENNITQSPLYAELKHQINRYFGAKSSRGNVKMWQKSCCTLLITTFIYWLTVFQGYVGLSPLIGILFAMIGLSIQHDASHGAFTRSSFWNQMTCFTNDVIGGSTYFWKRQHILAHHLSPNTIGVDLDTSSNFPLMKTHPKLPQRWYFQYQHIYASFLYCFLAFSYVLGDMYAFFQQSHSAFSNKDMVIFWMGKAVHIGIVWIVPTHFHGWRDGVIYISLPLVLIGGFVLASCFVVSHNAEHLLYTEHANSMDWAELQIRSSANWSIRSSFWLHFSGGLNFQIEHHLFPGVCHVYYPDISRIVQDVCAKHNIPYQAHSSFTSIFTSHLRNLKQLGSMFVF